MDKNYYNESDAIDMCIERMHGHITTMEQRALIASSLLYPLHKDISRLVDAILYGPDYMDAENMVDDIMKKLDAEDAKDNM